MWDLCCVELGWLESWLCCFWLLPSAYCFHFRRSWSSCRQRQHDQPDLHHQVQSRATILHLLVSFWRGKKTDTLCICSVLRIPRDDMIPSSWIRAAIWHDVLYIGQFSWSVRETCWLRLGGNSRDFARLKNNCNYCDGVRHAENVWADNQGRA